MIRYALKCTSDHAFESWFQSADAFDKLESSGMIVCPSCGSVDVAKAIMAPKVRPARSVAKMPLPAKSETPLTGPKSESETALAKMKKQVEENSDYVGVSFAAEARKMHDGDVPMRSIYGEARLDEAKKLLEDGVPVAPLPFIPQRKTN